MRSAPRDSPLDRLAELLSEVEPTQRDWYLVTTEFTLHAIRDPRAAWVLARHDARLRTEVARAFSECPRAAGRTLTVDPDDFARLLIAAPPLPSWWPRNGAPGLRSWHDFLPLSNAWPGG
ncbi:TetR family transcriptional regulator C-terminal domain-containing protein, partial [Streptomyces sp. NPDC005077]|uniref:TetR family transcriptional regulator C-terminal domain-containing protein n=1 Tax=Streptomyces sp. NPDC005077 TaxID=3154292 RepID=UPI00339E4D54